MNTKDKITATPAVERVTPVRNELTHEHLNQERFPILSDLLESNFMDRWSQSEVPEDAEIIELLYQETADCLTVNNHAALVERVRVLEEMLDVITRNAEIQPDFSMKGATDCYACRLEDIEEARAILSQKGGGK